jgi:hypothetical protein
MKAYAVTVTDEVTLLVAPDDINRPVYMQIMGNNTVYIGGADVSSTQGFPIEKHSAPLQGGLPPKTALYAICAEAASEEVRIIIPPTD